MASVCPTPHIIAKRIWISSGRVPLDKIYNKEDYLNFLVGQFLIRETNFLKQNILFTIMEIKVMLEEQEEGGFTVHVPSLPGCISEGENVEDALRNIREAIELHSCM